jgi:hypothetical protein
LTESEREVIAASGMVVDEGSVDPVVLDEGRARLACDRTFKRLLHGQLEALGKDPDVRSQLAFALLAQAAPAITDARHPRHRAMQGRVEAAYAAVARRAPDDPLSAWAHAHDCREAGACDVAFNRLARIEPDNAAVWLLAYSRARKRGDYAAADAYFARAGQAKYYDMHWGDAALFLRDVLPSTPVPECVAELADTEAPGTYPDTFALMAATMATMIRDIPPLVIEPCGRQQLRPGDAGQLARCRAVYRLMADSDTMLARSFGAGRMVELTAGDPEHAYWRERVREHAWATETGYALPQEEPFIAPWERGEWSVLVERMRRAGKWPVPAGWLPQHPYRRSLVLTGRETAR